VKIIFPTTLKFLDKSSGGVYWTKTPRHALSYLKIVLFLWGGLKGICKTTSPTAADHFVAKSVTTKSLQELRTVPVNTWCATLIERVRWTSCWTGTKEVERGRKRMDQLTRKQTPRDSPIFTPFYWNFQLVKAVEPAAGLLQPPTNSVQAHWYLQCIYHLLWR